MQEMNVQCIICRASVRQTSGQRESLECGVSGIAVSGGGRRIIRVDVSGDGGSTWSTARLSQETANPSPKESGFAWVLWEADIQVHITSALNGTSAAEGPSVVARAWDEACNTQPETIVWNLRGVGNNAWHWRRVDFVPPPRL